jgi:hypothetical protein
MKHSFGPVFLEPLPPFFTMNMEIELLYPGESRARRRPNYQSGLSGHDTLDHHCLRFLVREIVPIPEIKRVSHDKAILRTKFSDTFWTENFRNVCTLQYHGKYPNVCFTVSSTIGNTRMKLLPLAVWTHLNRIEVILHRENWIYLNSSARIFANTVN